MFFPCFLCVCWKHEVWSSGRANVWNNSIDLCMSSSSVYLADSQLLWLLIRLSPGSLLDVYRKRQAFSLIPEISWHYTYIRLSCFWVKGVGSLWTGAKWSSFWNLKTNWELSEKKEELIFDWRYLQKKRRFGSFIAYKNPVKVNSDFLLQHFDRIFCIFQNSH